MFIHLKQVAVVMLQMAILPNERNPKGLAMKFPSEAILEPHNIMDTKLQMELQKVHETRYFLGRESDAFQWEDSTFSSATLG